ncbi:unnamed protein product, partial [Allacma fusca]
IVMEVVLLLPELQLRSNYALTSAYLRSVDGVLDDSEQVLFAHGVDRDREDHGQAIQVQS